MNQELLRKKLVNIISNGLSATAIAKATGILRVNLSRFKNGKIYLIESEADTLNRYLELVKIPISNDLK